MASRTVEIVIQGRDRFTGTANKVLGSLNKIDSASGRVGKGVGQMATGFARAGAVIAGVAATGLVAAAKTAIDFEDAFAGVRKTMDEADLAKAGMTFESLALDFRKMATEIPIAATEFARIGETAGALGVRAEDINSFTKTVALLGVTTDLTADAAADAMGRIGTILNFTGKDYVRFGDILVNLGNKGASVESEIIEITKRFAGQGRQLGLTLEQIAGIASITASLGFGPERGGTALARVFANMATNISLANAKGKAFAKVVGEPVKDLVEDIRKGDAFDVFHGFLEGLAKLDRVEAAKALKAAGINNASDRQVFIDMSHNIDKVDQSVKDAIDSVGALGKEAQKRFDTIAAQLLLLKNNFIEVGITIGEGMLPAIGRATDKLIAFLQVDANKSKLKTFGEDIGKAIDSINWEQVLTGAQTFVSLLKDAFLVAKGIFDVLNTLPTEVKAAGLGLIGLNKISGGLIASGAGNILGGVAELGIRSAGSRLPGAAGRLFAQPVFVTNWPVGMGMGGGGVLGGKGGGLFGKLGSVLGILSIVGSLTAVIGEQQVQSQQSTAIGQEIHGTLREFLAQNPSKADLQNALGGVEQGIRDLESNPLNVLVQGEALNELRTMRAEINAALAGGSDFSGKPEVLGPPTPPGMGKTYNDPGGRLGMSRYSMDAIRMRALAAGFKPTDAAVQATFDRNLERQIAATNRVRDEAARTTAAALRSAFAIEHKADQVIPPPKVEVNVSVSASNVTHKTIHIRRYGPTGGSREISEGGGHGPLI